MCIRMVIQCSVSTNVTPISHEFYVKKDQTVFAKSVMKLTADNKIIFNDTGVGTLVTIKVLQILPQMVHSILQVMVTIDGQIKITKLYNNRNKCIIKPSGRRYCILIPQKVPYASMNGSAWHKVTSTAL